MVGARLLVRWCPVCRWRERGLWLLCGAGEGAFRYCPLGLVGWRGGASRAVDTVRD